MHTDFLAGKLLSGLRVLALVAFTGLAGAAEARTEEDRLLDAIAQVESGNNAMARGRAGERGPYQMKAVAWRQVQRLTGWREPHRLATNPHIARLYARAYWRYLQSMGPGGRLDLPTTVAAWRLGPHRALPSRSLSLSTRDAVSRIRNLMAVNHTIPTPTHR